MADDLTPRIGTATAPARRTVLRGVALAGGFSLAGGVLAACGDGGTTTGGTPTGSGTTGGDAPTTDAPGPAPESEGSSSPSAEPPALVAAAEVPVGGGVILAEAQVVVTQPVAGEYRGFSSICTHQSCQLAEVEGDTINCNCHGSRFSIADGSVQRGPAEQPLPEVPVQVRGGDIVEV